MVPGSKLSRRDADVTDKLTPAYRFANRGEILLCLEQELLRGRQAPLDDPCGHRRSYRTSATAPTA
jgi:hypothetical protein